MLNCLKNNQAAIWSNKRPCRVTFAAKIFCLRFMLKHLLGYLACGGMLCMLACTAQQSAKNRPAAEIQSFNRRYCVNDEQCVDVIVLYPVFSGGDSAAMAKFKTGINNYIVNVIGGPPDLPLESSIDSATNMFVNSFISYKRHNLEYMGNWVLQMVANVPLINDKLVSVELSQNMNSAPGSDFSLKHLKSYDLQAGKFLTIADIVTDTAAFRPMLEKSACQVLGLRSIDEMKPKLHALVDVFPMPFHVSIVPEGLHLAYNWYEITTDKIPITEIHFTWEQLGALVDKKRWMP